MTRDEIIGLAREVVAASGGQVAAAARLGVTQPRVSQALRDVKGSDGLRIRILQELGGLKVTEVFEVGEPQEENTTAPKRHRTPRGR